MRQQDCAKHSTKWRRGIALSFALILLTVLAGGCSTKQAPQAYQKSQKLDTSQRVELVISGSWKDCRGLDLVAQKFHEVYQNCTVEYEYLQDYADTLPKRVTSEDDRVDLFITPNIQEGSDRMAYALDLLEYPDQFSLSDTFPGLVENFKYTGSDAVTHLYVMPLGGEMRGLYVNTTLLQRLGLSVPTNRSELLAACEMLRDAGYIALQDNPGNFGQRLLFPYIAHLISTADASENARERLAGCEEDAVKLFRDPLEFLYNLTAENYYNYKYVETECKRFLDLSDEGVARSFLNINGSEGAYTKTDDIGAVPFMTAADSLRPSIDRVKENYHSKIEYTFILAPVSETGGFAYMSPSSGIAVNKNSAHVDWALEFMQFLFTAQNNCLFAETFNIMPNTTDVLDRISKKYDIPVESIGQPENVTFASYNFYNLIYPTLVSTAKANNPKYMQEDGKMYPFAYYYDSLKDAFAQQRAASQE